MRGPVPEPMTKAIEAAPTLLYPYEARLVDQLQVFGRDPRYCGLGKSLASERLLHPGSEIKGRKRNRMISRRKLTMLRKTMRLHHVHPRTQKALIEQVQDGLFELEVKKGHVSLILNHRRFEFRGTGLVAAESENRRT